VSDQVIDLANECVHIEQFGLKSSMNVAVVAGIVLWKLSKSPD
jgi:tRNA G18 (ribose-2'-O)-methylase SpoU